MRLSLIIALCLSLTACNSVYLKPGTLDKSQLVYASRGGYSMQRSIKQIMDERNYKVHVGTLRNESNFDSGDLHTYTIPAKAKYVVYVKERSELLRPIWCIFNGFWWWNFNVSVTDRKTGTEILSWRGRGCANSSLRKLNDILDELEMKDAAPKPKLKHKKNIEPGSAVLAQKPKNPELIIFANPK